MTPMADEFSEPGFPKTPPSRRTRIAAARLKVNIDKQRGVPTPDWIRELAETDTWNEPPDESQPGDQKPYPSHHGRVILARMKMRLDEKRGMTTPEWVRELAESEPPDTWDTDTAPDGGAGEGGTEAGKRAG